MDSRLVPLLCWAALYCGLASAACPDRCACQGNSVQCMYFDGLPKGLPKTTSNLKVTWMTGEIPSDAFLETPNLTNITITVSKINRISSCAFRGLYKLKALFMNATDIGSIDSHAFFHLENMDSIKISYSKIGMIKSNAFAGLKNIQKIELSVLDMGPIERSAFNGIQANSFHLWYVNGTSIQSNAITASSSIKDLAIYDSMFKNIDCGTIEVMKHLSQKFTFRGIDLRCDCKISWMLEPEMRMHLGEELLGQVNCTNLSPISLLKDLQMIDRHCPSHPGELCRQWPEEVMVNPCPLSSAGWVAHCNVCLTSALLCSFLVFVFRTGLW